MERFRFFHHGKNNRTYVIDIDCPMNGISRQNETYRVELWFFDHDDKYINVLVGPYNNYMMGMWNAMRAIQELERENVA